MNREIDFSRTRCVHVRSGPGFSDDAEIEAVFYEKDGKDWHRAIDRDALEMVRLFKEANPNFVAAALPANGLELWPAAPDQAGQAHQERSLSTSSDSSEHSENEQYTDPAAGYDFDGLAAMNVYTAHDGLRARCDYIDPAKGSRVYRAGDVPGLFRALADCHEQNTHPLQIVNAQLSFAEPEPEPAPEMHTSSERTVHSEREQERAITEAIWGDAEPNGYEDEGRDFEPVDLAAFH